MQRTRILLLGALLLGAFAGGASAASSVAADLHIGPAGHATVDVGYFYDDLSSYGNWVQRPQYGWAWIPHHRAARWRPYMDGHWAQTDYGWTWISSEPYGWATYHYGRWYLDPDYGWEWIPGNEWAPAWVSWQEGGDYVGWAPLPPSAEFSGSFGVDYGGVSFAASLTPEAYVFVPERQFLAPQISSCVIADSQVPVIYRETRNYTNYRFVDHRFINQGIPVDRIQRAVGRPVPRYQVADLAAGDRHQVRVAQNRVEFFRPQVNRAAQVAPPPSRSIARRAVLTAAAAAATIKTAHAAHQAYVAHANAAAARTASPASPHNPPQVAARQANAARTAKATATRQARAQQQEHRQQQAQARQQQAQARSARQVQARQVQQSRQQQARQAQARKQQPAPKQTRQARQQQQHQAPPRQARPPRERQAAPQQHAQAAERRQPRPQQQRQASQPQPRGGQGGGRPKGDHKPEGPKPPNA